MSAQEIIEQGFTPQDVKKVLSLYKNSEYKRNQFCPIVKVRAKSFGFGYRVPVTKEGGYYIDSIES
jgi:NAD+ synthase (glutamine-hydrolysing)